MAEKAKNAAAGLVSGLGSGSFPGMARIGGLARRLGELVKDWEGKLWALLPGGVRQRLFWVKGKFVFVLAGLVLVLAICLVILAAGLSGRSMPDEPAAAAGLVKPVPIPPEDLFLPEEPDFLPTVILERGRREIWTEEDAEPFWYKPLEDGGEDWRERMEKVIDDLLERVP
jgi:hypothetical protein